jgi:hypothetical protein
MYVRVKRQKTTIFVETEPTHTILEVKGKLERLLDGKVRVASNSIGPPGGTLLALAEMARLIVLSKHHLLVPDRSHFRVMLQSGAPLRNAVAQHPSAVSRIGCACM